MLSSGNAWAHISHSEPPRHAPSRASVGAGPALWFLFWLKDALEQRTIRNFENKMYYSQVLQDTWYGKVKAEREDGSGVLPLLRAEGRVSDEVA